MLAGAVSFLVLGTSVALAEGLVPCEGADDCNFAKLIEMANKVIKELILLGTSVFAIMFIYAGFQYLTAAGDTGKISSAHKVFTSALYGFIIMLSAWLLISFILTSLGVTKAEFKLI